MWVFATSAGLVALLTFILQILVMAYPYQIANWLLGLGVWFLPIYIIAQAVTYVVPPIGGSFINLAMLTVYGPGLGLVINYFVSVPCYFLNYWLAKKFGRPLLFKLVHQKGVAKIDSYSRMAGPKILVLLKLFEGGFYDYVSYAAGLTNFNFRSFFWVTILGGIPWGVLNYFIFTSSNNFAMAVITIQIAAAAFLVISVYLKRHDFIAKEGL